jgi:plasmid stability protein
MSALTIKNLDEAVLRRLAEKATSSGESMQEYVRQLLARDAQLRSADEMVELQRQRRATASEPEDLDAAVTRRATRHRVA